MNIIIKSILQNFVTSIKETKGEYKRASSVNRIIKLVEKEDEKEPKLNTTTVFWPKSKDALYLNEDNEAHEEDEEEYEAEGGEYEEADEVEEDSTDEDSVEEDGN